MWGAVIGMAGKAMAQKQKKDAADSGGGKGGGKPLPSLKGRELSKGRDGFAKMRKKDWE